LYLTPNLERLAGEGMKFTQAYACSVSSPTRVSLMTGMNAVRHRFTNWTMEKNKPTDGKNDLLQFPVWNMNGMSPVDSALSLRKPFFLYLSSYAVHTPFAPDNRFIQRYLDGGLPEPEAMYAPLVEGMDKSLGDVMDYLVRKGIADQTIILFVSDNGGLSAHARGGEPHTHNRPLSSGKGSAYEGGIRVPMIVKWTGIVHEGSVCDKPVMIEDFFPSILEMAGIHKYRTIQRIDGRSFIPLLNRSGNPSSGRCFYWHYPNEWGAKGPGIGAYSAIRNGDWKLIYFHAGRSPELYNLSEDIGETRNLATILGKYLRKEKAQMPVDKTTGKTVEYPDDILK
jgi:arylsulfatase A-like enzyme